MVFAKKLNNDFRKIRSYNYLDNHIVDRRLKHHFALDKVISDGFDEIIQGCLNRDIQERLTELVSATDKE